MKVYFIKEFDDRPFGLIHKAGTSAVLWETTAIRAIAERRAVPFNLKDAVKDEPQTESKASPKSAGAPKGTDKKKSKNKT